LHGCLDGRIVVLITLACLLPPCGLCSVFLRISRADRRGEPTSLLAHRLLYGIAFLLPLIALVPAAGASAIGPAPSGNQARGGIPDSFLYFSPQDPSQALLVEKASQRAYLYRSSNLSRPFRSYPCSTGENSGPKSERNDKRTPEGIYYATNSFQERDLAARYGVRAFPIDYPNPLDQQLGRTGYGIWLHGTNEALKQRDTNGCVVFRNKDIIDLSPYIDERQTPIIITEKINFVEEERIQREGRELKSLVMDWLRAWRESRVERYMSFYGKHCVAQGHNWHEWRVYHRRLSQKHRTRDIRIDDLHILREHRVVLARFSQTYQAGTFFSQGVKRLYLLKKSPEWKITYEFFEKNGSS
jgi:murein L,D-transpeptidase YafK